MADQMTTLTIACATDEIAAELHAVLAALLQTGVNTDRAQYSAPDGETIIYRWFYQPSDGPAPPEGVRTKIDDVIEDFPNITGYSWTG